MNDDTMREAGQRLIEKWHKLFTNYAEEFNAMYKESINFVNRSVGEAEKPKKKLFSFRKNNETEVKEIRNPILSIPNFDLPDPIIELYNSLDVEVMDEDDLNEDDLNEDENPFSIPEVPLPTAFTLDEIERAYKPEVMYDRRKKLLNLLPDSSMPITPALEREIKWFKRDIEIVRRMLDSQTQAKIRKDMELGAETVSIVRFAVFPDLPNGYCPSRKNVSRKRETSKKDDKPVNTPAPTQGTLFTEDMDESYSIYIPDRPRVNHISDSWFNYDHYAKEREKIKDEGMKTRLSNFIYIELKEHGDFWKAIDNMGIAAYTGTKYLRMAYPGVTDSRDVFPDGSDACVKWYNKYGGTNLQNTVAKLKKEAKQLAKKVSLSQSERPPINTTYINNAHTLIQTLHGEPKKKTILALNNRVFVHDHWETDDDLLAETLNVTTGTIRVMRRDIALTL
jgi:hypothetical protein